MLRGRGVALPGLMLVGSNGTQGFILGYAFRRLSEAQKLQLRLEYPVFAA